MMGTDLAASVAIKTGVVVVATGAARLIYVWITSIDDDDDDDDDIRTIKPVVWLKRQISRVAFSAGSALHYFRNTKTGVGSGHDYYTRFTCIISSVLSTFQRLRERVSHAKDIPCAVKTLDGDGGCNGRHSMRNEWKTGLPTSALPGSPLYLSPSCDASTLGLEESSVGMTVDEFRAAGHQLIEWIARYRETSHYFPVKSTVEPGYIRRGELVPPNAPEEGESWDAIMQDMNTVVLPGITHWESPQFMAYFKPHCSFPCVLAEIAGSGLAVNAFNWVSSPAATELEMSVTDWLARLLGLSEAFIGDCGGPGGGVIQGSAGEAVIVAVLAARARIVNLCVERFGSNGMESEKLRDNILSRLVL